MAEEDKVLFRDGTDTGVGGARGLRVRWVLSSCLAATGVPMSVAEEALRRSSSSSKSTSITVDWPEVLEVLFIALECS